MTIDEVLKSIKNEMGSECKYYAWKPTPKQSAFIYDESPVKLLTAPNRTGKSASLGRVIAELAWGKRGIRGQKHNHYNIIASSLTYQMSYSVMVPAIKQFIPDSWWNLDKKQNEILISNPSGITVRVYLRCQSQGREAVQGLSGSVVFDEQHSDESYVSELKMRAVDIGGEQIYAFTPLLGANFITDIPSAVKHTYCIADNPILSKAEMEAAAERMSDIEKRIRLYGEIVDLSGHRFISNTEIEAIRAQATKPVLERFNGVWYESYYTDTVYDEGVNYVIASDIASGSGEDYTAIVVYALYSNGVSEHVFSASSNLAEIPDTIAYLKEVYEKFNQPDMLCDATGLGISVAQTLQKECGMATMRRKDADQRFLVNKLGFGITEKSREWLLSEYRLSLSKRKHILGNDSKTFDELRVFAYDLSRRRYQHPTGNHDDMIFAHALANIAVDMTMTPEKPKSKTVKNYNQYTFDELEALERRVERYEEY